MVHKVEHVINQFNGSDLKSDLISILVLPNDYNLVLFQFNKRWNLKLYEVFVLEWKSGELLHNMNSRERVLFKKISFQV